MLKCVMYFSEYILKYIISKVKKKKNPYRHHHEYFFHTDAWKYWAPK